VLSDLRGRRRSVGAGVEAERVSISNVRKNTIQRSRHVTEIECPDQQARVMDLSAAAGAQEAPQLGFNRCPAPGGLVLHGSKSAEFSLRVDHVLDGGRAEGSDQLVLDILLAHIEAQAFQVVPSEPGADASQLTRSLKMALLRGVAEARESYV
jgi:hypothetical protein